MDLAIVTGAAGGMGRPCAKRFADEGRPVLLCDLNAASLEQVAAPLKAAGAKVEIFAGDIADETYPEKLLAVVGGRSIGALVHTAGLSPSMADGPRVLEVNYFASERLVKAVRPKMAKLSCIVLISSCSAYMVNSPEIDAVIKDLLAGKPDAARQMATTPEIAYPLSKRAIIGLVGRESIPLGALGVRIASIAPGFIDTPMGRKELESSAQMAAMVAKAPLGRMGDGDEIASVAVFLCSPGASYISGCDIKVDGGSLASLGF